jgi:hypothetical protein
MQLDSYKKNIARKISPMFSTPVAILKPAKKHFSAGAEIYSLH